MHTFKEEVYICGRGEGGERGERRGERGEERGGRREGRGGAM